MLHGLLLHRRQPLAVRVQLLDQSLKALVMGQLVDLLAQHGHILAGLGDALLGRAALHVKAQLADAAPVGVDLIEAGKEFFQLLLIRHIPISFPYSLPRLRGRGTASAVDEALSL